MKQVIPHAAGPAIHGPVHPFHRCPQTPWRPRWTRRSRPADLPVEPADADADAW